MEERARRVALNEAAFREANEVLTSLSSGTSENELDVVCECGFSDCIDQIVMTRAEYERLRSDATLFAVVRGHEIPAVETVVEDRQRYYVVQKHPDAHDLATQTDPRAPPPSPRAGTGCRSRSRARPGSDVWG